MDFTKIEANKNIHIFTSLFTTPASSFTQNINSVTFTPDYVIVKMINYVPSTNDNASDMYYIKSDLVSNETIGSFGVYLNVDPDNDYISAPVFPNLIFKLNKPIQGLFTFQIFNSAGQMYNLAGELSIHLDFIKLKAEHPQKVF